MKPDEAAKVLREESERIEKHGHMLCSGPTARTVKQALDAAVAALEQADTIIERARELIGLHTSEQEGMMIPTVAQFQDAVDALAQAIGAADQHPRERDLAQDAMK